MKPSSRSRKMTIRGLLTAPSFRQARWRTENSHQFGQLEGHHVAAPDAALPQRQRHQVRDPVELAVAEPRLLAGLGPLGDERRLVGRPRDGARQVVEERSRRASAPPPASRGAAPPAASGRSPSSPPRLFSRASRAPLLTPAALRSRRGVLHGGLARPLARDDQLHDLRGAVADLEAHHVAQALLVRQVQRPAVVAVRQQALVDRRPPPSSARATCTWRPRRCAARPRRAGAACGSRAAAPRRPDPRPRRAGR